MKKPVSFEVTPVLLAHSRRDLVNMSCNMRDAQGVDRQRNDGFRYFTTPETATSLASVCRGLDEVLVYSPQFEMVQAEARNRYGDAIRS